ncbi:MAG: hypothetical protein ACKO4K_01590 [Flavobacteriales bacterium]
MRIFCSIVFVFSGLWCTAQMTYYLTGRPFGFERNNAIKEVGIRWGINVTYVGNDVAETQGLAAINTANERVNQEMEKTNGVDWLTAFYLQVDKEEALHQRIRQALNLPINGAGSNRFIMIRKLDKKRYEAFELDASSSSHARCVARYLGKAKNKVRMKLQESGCELPYDFPQNGIIK